MLPGRSRPDAHTARGICLQKDLQSNADGAAARQEIDRLMEVNLGRGGQNRSRFGVVAGAREGVQAPLLNSLELGLYDGCEVCG